MLVRSTLHEVTRRLILSDACFYALRAQVHDGGLPTCQAEWFSRPVPLDCLFVCNACSTKGVSKLTRSSGKHTEMHHLIRCLALEKDAPATKQWLISTEAASMTCKRSSNDLGGLIGHSLVALAGNIEQLLQRLVGIGGAGCTLKINTTSPVRQKGRAVAMRDSTVKLATNLRLATATCGHVNLDKSTILYSMDGGRDTNGS